MSGGQPICICISCVITIMYEYVVIIYYICIRIWELSEIQLFARIFSMKIFSTATKSVSTKKHQFAHRLIMVVNSSQFAR